MPYIKEDGGRLNNYAVEPKMYVAEPTSKAQKRTYLLASVAGLLLVSGLIAIAFMAS